MKTILFTEDELELRKKIDEALDKCLNDPKLQEETEEYQKKYGTFSEEDLRKMFTI